MAASSFDSDLSLARALLPAWSDYIPHVPTAKQLAFLMLPHREALYGGQVGGGKSEALLMAAAMYVDVPYYSALILRRTLTDLQQAEGLLQRAHEWWDPFPEIRFNYQEHTFIWPNGARIKFSYIGDLYSWEQFQGGAYQFIGWDELTQHAEEFYQEVKSRARRLKCGLHEGRVIDSKPSPLPFDPECPTCARYAPLSRVPIRVRSTTNPGGRGHYWVKKYFGIHYDNETVDWVGSFPERPFIPAGLDDNPYLDSEAYRRQLETLDEARRAQLEEGNWDRLATGRFKSADFRYCTLRGAYVVVIDPTHGLPTDTFHIDSIQTFAIIDPATSVREGVAGVKFYKYQDPSWSAMAVFGVLPRKGLVVLDVRRWQCETPDLLAHLTKLCQDWPRLSFVGMEVNGPGEPIAQMAVDRGIPVKEILTTRDKIANSSRAQEMARRGRLYLMQDATWLDDFRTELTCWTGHPHETDDQVDVLSNAANEYRTLVGSPTREVTMASHLSQPPIAAGAPDPLTTDYEAFLELGALAHK